MQTRQAYRTVTPTDPGTARAEHAPAKINLTLHVTGQRPDGYHLLDSLVIFAAVGDVIRLSPGPLSLRITGPYGAGLAADDSNLCLRAARLAGREAAIVLEKNLPLASGIGGGSADAAAVLRAFDAHPERPELLGADVPACLANRPIRMRGVGEVLEPLPRLPDFHMVLVNPGVALSTPAVFGTLAQRNNRPMPPLSDWGDLDALLHDLRQCRNDLEPAAVSLAPSIADCLAALANAGAALARMSGSGATCFGIFPDERAAIAAAEAIRRPGWWVVATGLAQPGGLG